MKSALRTSALLLCFLGVGGLASAQSSAPAAQGDANAKVAPLLVMALSTLGKTALDEAVDQGLFSRLYHSVFGGAGKEKASAPVASEPAAAAAGEARIVPSVAYSLEQLDPQTFQVIRSHRLAGAIPVLKSGDVFALHYSTNLPGLVRLENTDSTGLVTNLGTYVVWPDRTNRLPEQKGIMLSGAAGNEVVKILFYPCLPREAAGSELARRFAAKIPACEAAAGRVNAAAQGTIGTKALVNLAQPDATTSFSATGDYQPEDVTSTVLVLRHDKP